MFSCDFCKVLKNNFFTEYFQECFWIQIFAHLLCMNIRKQVSECQGILPLLFVLLLHNQRRNVRWALINARSVKDYLTQPSEFGKKTDSKKMPSYLKIMTAKQTTTVKMCRHVLCLRRQNSIGLLAKLACVSLLRSKKDVWEGNMLFIPFLS